MFVSDCSVIHAVAAKLFPSLTPPEDAPEDEDMRDPKRQKMAELLITTYELPLVVQGCCRGINRPPPWTVAFHMALACTSFMLHR